MYPGTNICTGRHIYIHQEYQRSIVKPLLRNINYTNETDSSSDLKHSSDIKDVDDVDTGYSRDECCPIHDMLDSSDDSANKSSMVQGGNDITNFLSHDGSYLHALST